MAKRMTKTEGDFNKSYVRWTEEEKKLIMTSNLTDKELSEKLSRSIVSIHNQRYILRHRRKGDE